MARFEVTTVVRPAHIVVALAGECDLAGRDDLTSALLGAVSRSPVVLVDMAGLAFLDSSGLHGLIRAHRSALAAGGHVYVVNASGAVARLLELTGVGDLLRPPADTAGLDA